MAIKMVSFFLAGLYLAGLGLAAPTTPPSLTSDTVLETATEELDLKRSRISRLDMVAWGRFSAKTAQAPKYILDATLGLFETNADAEVVPVFATHMDKAVIIDTNGELLATYGGDKFVPVWARPWKAHRYHGGSRFSRTLAMFILGFSLSMALICSFFRSLCPKEDGEPGTVEQGMAVYDDIQEEKRRVMAAEESRA